MAEVKISQLPELTESDNADLIPIVDVSDTTDGLSGSTKFIKKENLIPPGSNGVGYTGLKFVSLINPLALGPINVVTSFPDSATAFVIGDYIKCHEITTDAYMCGTITAFLDNDMTIEVDEIFGASGENWRISLAGKNGIIGVNGKGYSDFNSATYFSFAQDNAETIEVSLSPSDTAFKVGDYIKLYDAVYSTEIGAEITAFETVGIVQELTFVMRESQGIGDGDNWSISLGGRKGNTGPTGSQVIKTDISNTSTILGWSSFTKKEIFVYRVDDKIVHVAFDIQGTSNSTAASFTVPIVSANERVFLSTYSVNGGVVKPSPGRGVINTNSNIVTFYSDSSSAAWTANGQKYIKGQFFYEI